MSSPALNALFQERKNKVTTVNVHRLTIIIMIISVEEFWRWFGGEKQE